MVIKLLVLFFAIFESSAGWCPDVPPNTLSDLEIDAECILLFNGINMDGWEYLRPLDSNWTIKDGVLTTSHLAPNRPSGALTDIATTTNFTSGIFKFEWRLDAGGNSGVKYYCDLDALYHETPNRKRSAVCPEYQILDDKGFFPDSWYPNRTAGALYELIPPYKHKPLNPLGEWNCGEIHTDGAYTEFWMNGALVVYFNRHSKSFREAVLRSKFKPIAQTFGQTETSPLVLQDHGQAAYFRSVKYCPVSNLSKRSVSY